MGSIVRRLSSGGYLINISSSSQPSDVTGMDVSRNGNLCGEGLLSDKLWQQMLR